MGTKIQRATGVPVPSGVGVAGATDEEGWEWGVCGELGWGKCKDEVAGDSSETMRRKYGKAGAEAHGSWV